MVSLSSILPYREDILRIAAMHGGRDVSVFGSFVRGEARADSDLDLLVELEPGRSLLDRIAIKQDLEDLLGRPVDVLSRTTVHPLIRDKVIAESVPL